MKIIKIWCDGGARNNGSKDNVGGFGVYLTYGDYKKEYCEGFIGVTNNQMELQGVIKALELIKTNNIPIEIYIDSAYVVNGINTWVHNWKKNGWRKSNNKTIENIDLWKKLYKLAGLQENLKFIKVRGHSGVKGNEKADMLANEGMDRMENK